MSGVTRGFRRPEGRRVAGSSPRASTTPVNSRPRHGFPGTQTYQRDEWLEHLLSRSDHTALEPVVQQRLFEGIAAAIDDFGGSFVM